MDGSDSQVARRIGDRIRIQRRVLRLTQKELGERIGKSQNSVSEFETGTITPSGETLRRLSLALDQPADWILNGATSLADETQDLLARLLEAFGEDGPRLLSEASDDDLKRLARLFRALQAEKVAGD